MSATVNIVGTRQQAAVQQLTVSPARQENKKNEERRHRETPACVCVTKLSQTEAHLSTHIYLYSSTHVTKQQDIYTTHTYIHHQQHTHVHTSPNNSTRIFIHHQTATDNKTPREVSLQLPSHRARLFGCSVEEERARDNESLSE